MFDQVAEMARRLSRLHAGKRWSLEAARAGLARAAEAHRAKLRQMDALWSNRQALVRISAEHPQLAEIDREETATQRWLEHFAVWRDTLQDLVNSLEAEELQARKAMAERPHTHQFEQTWRDQLYAGEECQLCTTRRIVSAHNPALVLNAGTVAHQRWLDGGPAPGDVSDIRARPASDYGTWR